jgi:hypothetical protein
VRFLLLPSPLILINTLTDCTPNKLRRIVSHKKGHSFMKEILILLSSLILSFNSYGEWVYIDTEKNSDTEVYILTDSIEIEDGYVYWTYLNNYSEPRSEYNIMGLAIFRGGDCENNRYVNIESQMFQGSMGTKEFGKRLKPEQEWTSPSSGQIDEKIFNYVCDYAGLTQSKIEEKPQSESNSINGWRKIGKNATGDTFYVDENIRKNNSYIYFWLLADYDIPINSRDANFYSSINYYQADCGMLRKKLLDSNYFLGQMGKGKSETFGTDDKWTYAAPGSTNSKILNYVCNF